MPPIIKAVVHVPTGEFRSKNGGFDCGPFEPQRPVLSVVNGVTNYDPDYDVVVVLEGTSQRLHRWSNGARVNRTAQELAAWDAAQPKFIHRLEVVRRLSSQTKQRMMNMALVNLTVAEWWSRLMAGGASNGDIDIHGPEWVQGKAAIQAVGIGIGKIWDNQAAFDAEAATVEA